MIEKTVDRTTKSMIVSEVAAPASQIYSLEAWMENPPDSQEWIDGELVEKNGMTLKHSKVQGNLYFSWRNYKDSSRLGGEVYTDVPCRTNKQGRYPDVAYLPPELVAQFGNLKVLPQSFPLCAEIVSPTDLAEDVIAKAAEYLTSGSEEVWLVYPENQWIIAVTKQTRTIFIAGEVVSTQVVLPGFSIPVDELLK
jgi:Uma2 family endonuclease